MVFAKPQTHHDTLFTAKLLNLKVEAEMTTKIILFFTIPLILNILDLMTTYVGLVYFGLIELNPLFGELMIIFKLSFFILIIPLSYFVIKKQNNLKTPFLIFHSAFIVIFSIVVINNILVIQSVLK